MIAVYWELEMFSCGVWWWCKKLSLAVEIDVWDYRFLDVAPPKLILTWSERLRIGLFICEQSILILLILLPGNTAISLKEPSSMSTQVFTLNRPLVGGLC